MKEFLKYAFLSVLLWFSSVAYAQLNTDRLLSIGRNALYFEDYILSIQYFNQIIRIKPYLAEPYYFRAIAKIQLEDYEGAEQDINEVLLRNPFIAGAFYARGFARKQIGKLSEAEADFDKALEFSPDNLSVLLNRIELYERQEKYDQALQEIDTLIKRKVELDVLGFERGRLLFMKGDTLGSLQSFDRLIEQDSTSDEGWGMRGLIHLQMGNREAALADYNEAIKRNRYNSNYYINRGILNYWKKNYKGALADFDRAIELDPQNQLSLFNRALLRDEVGDYDRAIDDLNKTLQLNPNFYEALLKRAEIYIGKGEWSSAERDFTTILIRYPNFVPAYYGRSTAQRNLGMVQSAYLDIETAQQLEKNKDKIKKEISTEAQYAEEESVQDRTKDFDTSGGTDLAKSKYDNKLRGAVQNRFADVVNERNFAISYYAHTENAGQHYYKCIAEIDNSGILPAKLKITNNELALTSSSIDFHNQSINHFSHLIQDNADNAYLYFGRGIDYALTQDYNSAINDFSNAIAINPEFVIAYFCRANIRYKQLERMLNDQEKTPAETEENLLQKNKNKTLGTVQHISPDKKYNYDFELIMRDYDKTIELAPEFEYAWFNKANLLCSQKDFRSAIKHYSKAIEINPEFAEAYFNRGLTRIYTGDTKDGFADLSKAGELGIYQSYNLLKRLKK